MDKLLQNEVILSKIFLYLSLEEQIQCLDICQPFHYAITKKLWKKQYRTLNIYKTPYISVITNTKTEEYEDDYEDHRKLEKCQEYKVSLKYDKCNIFLRNVAKYVHRLGVFSEYCIFRRSMGIAFRNVHMFIHLRQLAFNQMVVTTNILELIVVKCEMLNKLEFIECTCEAWNPLIPGYNLDITTLAKLSRLRELILCCEKHDQLPNMEYDILYEMLSKLRLTHLVLKNINIVDFGADTVQQIKYSACLEVLHMGNISFEFWPHFKHHLRDFCNIRDLTLQVMDCNTKVTTPDLELMAISSPKLCRLYLENCDLHVEEFGFLKTLKHLTLKSCGGLTSSNLQQILAQLMSLKSLNLINTRVLGNIEEMQFSSSLESIRIDTIYFYPISEAFRKSTNNALNLHTIKWLNGDISDSWIMDKCPHLKVLHVPNPYLIRYSILKMSGLQELSLTSCKLFSWCFLVILIQNLKLSRLRIQTSDGIDDAKEKPQNGRNVRTTLKKVVLPYRIYKTAQDFWMDLLWSNRALRLVFYGEHEDLLSTNFLKGLLRFPHVRDNLRTIKVCGFILDINDLQENLERTLQQTNAKTSHFRSRNAKFTIEL
ncbi:uncharacterized protein LOC142233778 [Haematobia irritans]|uniref:uncharacterized protein LOC142233778 n=1 Tax=Haematobia irritans TaxID=7368 RepID=UPI003F506935